MKGGEGTFMTTYESGGRSGAGGEGAVCVTGNDNGSLPGLCRE